MSQTTSTKSKRDLSTGFFGWVLLGNLIFLPFAVGIDWTGYKEELFSKIFLLSTFFAILALFALRKFALGAGVVAALIIHVGVWAGILFLFGLRTPEYLLYNLRVFAGFPLPLGIYILMLGFT